MVAVLEDYMVKEMAEIGRKRLPAEAAGILLPYRWNDQLVIELPNRSKTPHDHFEMWNEDLAVALQDWAVAHPDPSTWDQVVLWHTHPSGNLGPSKYDLENRPGAAIRCLVISLDDEEGDKATWY